MHSINLYIASPRNQGSPRETAGGVVSYISHDLAQSLTSISTLSTAYACGSELCIIKL